MSLAFVIPALNERDSIGRTLDSIRAHAADLVGEVLVVDNGSSDGTGDVAISHGARVLNHPSGTIAAVRNAGARACRGSILVFLDADVSLTQAWEDNISGCLDLLQREPSTVSGSRCAPVDENSFLNRFWFSRLHSTRAQSYINSGHMIVTRELFDSLGGFDEDRETAEDHDLCTRVIAFGGNVRSWPSLHVVHHGYPVSVRGFLYRERWHGLDDFRNLASFRASRTAWVVTALLLSAVLAIAMSLVTLSIVPLLCYTLFLGMALVGLTLLKFGMAGPLTTAGSAAIFLLYLAGRSMSLTTLVGGAERASRSPNRS